MWIKLLKSSVGWDAQPENDKEAMAVELGNKIMSIASKAINEAGINGYSSQQERQQMVEVQKNAIESFVLENKNDIKDVYNLIYDHLEDNNFHTTNDALAQIMNIK